MGKNFELPKFSESECRKVVSAKLNSEDFIILNHQVFPFEEINSYLGEHCTLKITVERNSIHETHSFFVKSLPKTELHLKFLEAINGIYKEKNFYDRFCPLLKKHGIDLLDDVVPRCYYSTEESFVFEDVKAKGYESFSPRTPLGVDCVKLALSAFAKLHASGLVLEEMKNFRLNEDFGVELGESFYLGTDVTKEGIKSAKTGIRAMIDMTHDDEMKISKNVFKEKALEGLDLQQFYVTPTSRFRNSLSHGDTGTKNFLFKLEDGKPKDCVIVDFQTYRYAPPAQDVLCFIYMATDRELRREHFEELLEYYYNELEYNIEKYGFKDVVTRDEFFESCIYFRQFALTQTVIHFQVVVMSDEIGTEVFEDQDLVRCVLFQDKYYFMKMACQRDPIYRDRNVEAITDLRKFYESKLSK